MKTKRSITSKKTPGLASPRGLNGYVHPLTRLRDDYDHLMARTWQLFEYGKKREYKLETAVVNAWKYFGEIAETDDMERIKEIALSMRKLMAKTMKSDSK